jgi:predicted exporter
VTLVSRGAIALWIVGLLACVAVIARTRLSTDMTAFLPRSPSPAQQVLVDQVQNGVVSRLILLAVTGAPGEALAALSKEMGKRLRPAQEIALVANGEEVGLELERDFIWGHRYLLSHAVTPEHFTAASLRQALENDLQLLRSDMGMLVKRSLPNDPTGEILLLLGQFAGDTRPPSRDGVWFSGDGKRAILLVQTRASGFDIDAQQRALELIGAAFDDARQALPQAGAAWLLETGPAVFAVRTRATMKHDASVFSAIASALVAGVLLLAYRSPRLLALSFLPVGSGALAGIAAVGLGFGFVHGITLGFGVTLIGEAVDYAIYLFTQTTPGSAPETTLPRIWPTLRLGVLTSIFGFSAMLFSSFSGFAQLGLFSIAGLIAAVSVTRWVLPALVPRDLAVASTILAPAVRAVVRRARRLRLPLLLLVLLAAVVLVLHRHGFWAEEISSLSPIPAADQRLDQELRRDTGAPDVRYLLVAAAADEQRALAVAERLGGVLDGLVADKALAGFDAPDRYLPSEVTQRARQSALPSEDVLRENLRQALEGLPFRPDLFAPFLADVAAAKLEKPITRSDLPPALSLRLDSLLFERNGQWVAMLPLRGVVDTQAVLRAVAALGDADIVFVDLKGESDTLLKTYQHEAIVLAAIGGLVITVLLSAALRSVRRVWLVLAPLAAAVIVTASSLTAGDQKLSIFNLVGLLLVVAVGSNYSLFFERQSGADQQGDRTVASLVLANTCTVIGFGVLSFSSMAVLHDIGMTVAVGTFLSLIFAAILSTGYASGGSGRAAEIRP